MAQGQVNLDVLLRSVNCYKNVARVKADTMSCIAQVRTLIPKVERLIHNNGAESELLVLSGTIAMFYQGKQYNIPVDIYISEPYPEVPPRCYVRPTKDMEVKIGHRHVDREGLVYLPYLHEWQPRTHNLLELCGHMSSVFGAEPPVYAVRRPQQQQPPPGQFGPGSGYMAGPSSSSSSSRLQPPPSYDSVARPPNPYAVGPMGAGGYQSSVTAIQAQSVAQQQAEAERKRRETAGQVTAKLQRSLQEFYQKVRAEVTEEYEKQAKLQSNGRDVAAAVETLGSTKVLLQDRLQALGDKSQQLEAWLAAEGKKEDMPLDNFVEAVDVPSKQMLELVAENAALDDVLYHADRAMANGSLDVTTFLREVRKLARDQFMCVALINKIVKTQQQSSSPLPPQGGQAGPSAGYNVNVVR